MADPGEPSPASSLSIPRTRRPLDPSGVGGWLLLFVIGQVGTLITLAVALGQFPEALRSSDALAGIPAYKPFLIAEGICQAIIALGAIVGLVLIFTRDFRAPIFYQVLLGFIMLFGLVEISGVYLTYADLANLAGHVGQDDAAAALDRFEAYVKSGRQVVFGGVWLLYWRKSVRIANTFAPDRQE